MLFNFTFEFPEVESLNKITISIEKIEIVDNILEFYGPTF